MPTRRSHLRTGARDARAITTWLLTIVMVALTFLLVLTPPVAKGTDEGFTIVADPQTLAVTQGSNNTSTITLISQLGFSGLVTISSHWDVPEPSGVEAFIEGEKQIYLTSGEKAVSTLWVEAITKASIGTYVLRVEGVCGNVTNATYLDISIVKAPFDFSLSVKPPSITLTAEETARFEITVTQKEGPSKQIELSIAGLPADATAIFDPQGVTPPGVSTLTVRAGKTLGNFNPTITGTYDAEQRSTSVTLTIESAPSWLVPGVLATVGGAVAVGGAALALRARKPPTPPEIPLPLSERIVNTGFSTPTHAGEPLSSDQPLVPGRAYYFWFEVEPPAPGSMEVKPDPLMIEFVPSEARLKVALFAFEGELEITPGNDVGEIQILSDGAVKVARQVKRPESLPRDSELEDRRLFFPVRTPTREGTVRLRCNMYYEQILVRSQLIKVLVASSTGRTPTRLAGPALQSTVEYAMSKTLNPHFLVRMQPQSLSVMLNDTGDSTHSFRIFGTQEYKRDASFTAVHLSSLIDAARSELRKASWTEGGAWTEDKQYRYAGDSDLTRLKADLINFAICGYRFYAGLTSQIAPGMPKVMELEKRTLKPSTLEFVIRDKNEASNYMFPAALIYDHFLDTGINRDQYTLCPAFLNALEAEEPLVEASCFQGDCPSRGNGAVICPSGFWGFRHAIGMPLGSASETNHEILYQRAPELTVAVYPAFPEWPRHQQALKALSTEVIWNIADTRAETLSLLRSTKPHVVYFYCHGGIRRNVPYLKVGREREMGIEPTNLFKVIWWESPQPLVFINGCHTTALEPTQVLNFVDSFITWNHAAGVIGTEIAIFEALACAFSEECLRRFVIEGETIGEAVRGTRLTLLKHGNPLGLIYNIYANASLRLKKVGESNNE